MICPKCNSTEIHAEKRGWSFLTGMIGSRKIYLTCLSCGHRFKPGQHTQVEPHGIPVAGLSPEGRTLLRGVGRTIGRLTRKRR